MWNPKIKRNAILMFIASSMLIGKAFKRAGSILWLQMLHQQVEMLSTSTSQLHVPNSKSKQCTWSTQDSNPVRRLLRAGRWAKEEPAASCLGPCIQQHICFQHH